LYLHSLSYSLSFQVTIRAAPPVRISLRIQLIGFGVLAVVSLKLYLGTPSGLSSGSNTSGTKPIN
jgi:hypothetical protein